MVINQILQFFWLHSLVGIPIFLYFSILYGICCGRSQETLIQYHFSFQGNIFLSKDKEFSTFKILQQVLDKNANVSFECPTSHI